LIFEKIREYYMYPIVLDLETSTGNREIHGPSSKDPENDFYTIIYGGHPDAITIKHELAGFNRTISSSFFVGCDIIIGHNIAFDLGYIWRTSALQSYLSNPENTIWDTAEAEYILSSQRHKYPSLAELQDIYLGERVKQNRISNLFKAGIGADKILAARYTHPRLFALYEKYCIGDGSSTLRIFSKQYKKAKELGMLDLIKARMRGLLAVIQMQNTGIQIDEHKCQETLKDFKIKSLHYLQEATDLTRQLWDSRLGVFNINSPKQKSAMLFGGAFEIKEKVEDGFYKNGNPKSKTILKEIHIKGLELNPVYYSEETKKPGVYVTEDAVIHKIYKDCKDPLVIKYCELQKKAMTYGKMCSTYLEPFLRFSVGGLLYPNYNTTATETSRLSSSRPNQQNVPASGEMLVPIQGQLVAPEGWLACDIDYSSLEPHITALVTGDTNLTHDLLSGVCLHCRAVSWLPRLSEGKSYEEIYQLAVIQKDPHWVLMRKKAKGVNFKRAYGGGAASLAEAEGLDIDDVKTIFASQDEIYSGVKAFNDKLYANLSENQQLSREMHFSKSSKGGRRFQAGLELLPIFDQAGNKQYMNGEYRHFGTYLSPLKHTFSFEETGRLDKWGKLRRGYSTTETKNYHIQGTAGDLVLAAASECTLYVIQHHTELKMVRQIHDSLSMYIRKDTENTHIPALQNIMNNAKYLLKKYYNYDAAFNFKTEAKVGPNFAEMIVYEGDQ